MSERYIRVCITMWSKRIFMRNPSLSLHITHKPVTNHKW
jgi:hypothetical protein